jgi:glycosyltransferase involved in cell wall biosynthesis
MDLKISFICTVLNEEASIERLLASLARQSLLPNEIIFVDGGSSDNTVAILEEYAGRYQLPLKVMTAPGANISQGRNIAIEAAAGPIIACTDAGVHLDRDWLKELIIPFQAQPALAVVSGFFVPDPHSAFETAMGATVLPLVTDINPASFLPSSRSIAFLKSSWLAAGRYPEWIDFCEDLIFDLRLRDEVGEFVFAPKAVVYFRPRSTLRAFFKQYYQYARGDGKADLWRKRHAIRYFTYLAALPALLLVGLVVSPWGWVVGGCLGGLGMFFTPYRRLVKLWHRLSGLEKIEAIFWVPMIRITGDVAKMIGYPVGLAWRWSRLAQQPELRWRQPKKLPQS